MKIIGEKINGTRKRVAQAIQDRDSGFIQDLARSQAEAGADWLDANAGTSPSREADDLIWLIENIQAVTDKPICIDTANEKALEIAIKAVNKTPMVNSISGEPHRLAMIPIVAENKCPAVALALDEQGVPKTVDDRLRVVGNLLKETRKAGIEDDQLYFDPLAMTIATNTESGNIFFDSIRAIRKEYPKVHITCGLSNISFGLPARAHINRVFMSLAMQAGLDCAIMDPNDRDLRSAIYCTELLLGLDRHCLRYTRAFRAGVFNK